MYSPARPRIGAEDGRAWEATLTTQGCLGQVPVTPSMLFNAGNVHPEAEQLFLQVSLQGHPTEDVRILVQRTISGPVINPDVCSRHGPNAPSGDESPMPGLGLDSQISSSCPRSEPLLVLNGSCSFRSLRLRAACSTSEAHQSHDQRPGLLLTGVMRAVPGR